VSVVVTHGCGFSARFVFSVHDVAVLMQKRAENLRVSPGRLTLREPERSGTS